jgi:hypothetical protein
MTNLFNALKGLFVNGVGGYSFGRVIFWMMFVLALYMWGWKNQDIYPFHFGLMVAVLGYVLSGKFRTVTKFNGIEFSGQNGQEERSSEAEQTSEELK